MTRPFRLGIEDLWLGLPIAVLVWFSFLRPIGLLDFWWHLKLGELIVTTRSLPRVDLFSYTCTGRPFVPQNWLVEVLYYATYRVGGLPLVLTLNTAFLVAAFLPVYDLCGKAAGDVRTAVVAASIGMMSLVSFGNVRSQVVSFLFFSVTYWILGDYRARRYDRVWLLPALMVVWVNAHGAFVVGLALIGLVLGAETVRRLALGARDDALPAGALWKLAVVLLVAAIATVANPEGVGLYAAMAAVSGTRSFVMEWQTPGLDRLGVTAFYGPFLATLAVLVYARRRLHLTDVVLFVAFAAFAFSAIRNAVWFALVSSPIVARYLPPLASKRASAAPVRHGVNAAIAVAMVGVAVVASPWVRPLLSPRGRATWLDPRTPVGAVDYIERRGIRDRIFHPEIYGDYLVWRLWPQQRSFVDSRVHLFPACPRVVDDYDRVFSDPRWEERLAAYGIRYLMLSKDEADDAPMIAVARSGAAWRVVYEDGSTVIFEKIAA
jgi:hypothetical protein